MIYLIVILILFNLGTQGYFLFNFKRLFSTDDIINSTKAEYNKIIMDLNNQADRNISIIDERINRLKALIQEADKKIKLLADLDAKATNLKEFQTKYQALKARSEASPKPVTGPINNYAQRRARLSYEAQPVAHPVGNASSVTRMMEQDLNVTPVEIKEPTEPKAIVESPKPETLKETVTPLSSAADLDFPSFEPKVFIDENQVDQPDFKMRVASNYDQGFSVEEIAKKFNCSTTEVQFALALENRI